MRQACFKNELLANCPLSFILHLNLCFLEPFSFLKTTQIVTVLPFVYLPFLTFSEALPRIWALKASLCAFLSCGHAWVSKKLESACTPRVKCFPDDAAWFISFETELRREHLPRWKLQLIHVLVPGMRGSKWAGAAFFGSHCRALVWLFPSER